MGLTPVQVDIISNQQQSKKGKVSRDKINVQTLSLVTRQLSTLISAGQPVESSLYAVSQQTNKTQVKKVLLSVRARVLEGYALSDALRDFPRVFDSMYCASVHAGEQSGLLDLVMERLADFMESRQSLQQKTKLALIYPVLLTVVSILLVSGLLTFVVPQIIQVFDGFDTELPLLTQWLIIISDFFKVYGLQVIISIFLISLMYGQLLKVSWVKSLRDHVLLKLPMISYLTKLSNTSRFTRTMSILVSSGVQALDAIHISTEVLTNVHIHAATIQAADRVREGASISESLAQTGYYSPLVLQLISNGEASGKLGEMLERSAKAEESEFEGVTALFLGIFEPVMILVMGVVVLIIVLAILLPIFDMNDLIQ